MNQYKNFIEKRKELKRDKTFAKFCQSIGYYTLLAIGGSVLAIISIISLNIIL
jgi:hypothetical protein